MRKPSSRNRDLELLEREIESREYTELLQKLKTDTPFYQRFETWADVVAFARGRKLKDPKMDEVLAPIFRAHSEDNDPRWRQILIVIFWLALEVIQHLKLGMASDPFDLWQDIQCTFLEVLCRIDLKKRPRRLAPKVYNETIHRLHDEYRRKQRQSGLEEFTADWDTLEELAEPIEGIDFAGIEWRERREAEINKLHPYVDQGTISEEDFQLIVATRLDGLSIADYCRRAHLNYETARKRRQRAEAAIDRAKPSEPEADEVLDGADEGVPSQDAEGAF